MKKILLLLFVGIICQSSTPYWGAIGHRVVGEIAENTLSRKANKKISELLNGRSLAWYSTYADEIKYDSEFKKYSPWHYVNFPDNQSYTESEKSEKGDLVMAIQKCIEVLKDASSTIEDQQFYLKLLIHFMGDLHMPLHVGHAEDKGGNDIQVQFRGKGTNLHALWDWGMIELYGMSYLEIVDKMPDLRRRERKSIQEGELLDWVQESKEMSLLVYASATSGDTLDYNYADQFQPLVFQQLQKAGLRLAKILEEIY